MNQRQQLLKKLQEAQFALVETNLFLDTHPTDVKGLEYYEKYRDMTNMYKKEYIEKYGPLTNMDVKPTDKFTWVNNPWPWEVTE